MRAEPPDQWGRLRALPMEVGAMASGDAIRRAGKYCRRADWVVLVHDARVMSGEPPECA